MTLLVIRHAKAGDRSAWSGDDVLRPLVPKGHRQAVALKERYAGSPIRRIVSSPYTRCVQTVQPLAEALGLTIEITDALTEGADFATALRLAEELPDDSVLCSHGDVIPALIDALVRRGMQIDGTPDWRKGSVWLIERDEPWRAVPVGPPGP